MTDSTQGNRNEPLTRAHLREGGVVEQARGLLGCHIVTDRPSGRCVARIVETEAYRGADDRAAHSFGYRRTPRTEVFYGDAGHAYVYLIYGIHRMFNIVVGPPGEPNAILVRAVEPVEGKELMQERRGAFYSDRRLTGGPGLLCQALDLRLEDYGTDLLDPKGVVRLQGDFSSIPDDRIESSARVGVAYAGSCAMRPWRFRLRENPFVSPAT